MTRTTAEVETRPPAPGGEADDGLAAERAAILVVDDLPEKLLVFGTVLEELGQELVFVRSGAEALREVLHREFAVILLDINMPDMDGFETAGLIRQYKKSAHTPIIFITAYADEIQAGRGYSLGAVDFILSPVVPDILRTKVRVFVELHAMRQRARLQGEERAARMAAEAARRVAEDNDRRSAFLADASRRLASSLDIAVAERLFVDLLVPGLGDFALLIRTTPDGRPERALAAHAPDVAGARTSVPTAALGPALRALLAHVRTTEVAVPLSPAALAELRALPLGAALAAETLQTVTVPLATPRRSHGVVVLARTGAAPLDVPLLQELVARAAIALENARLYDSLRVENAERMSAEAKLQQANRRKDEFLAMLSHELRNPLAPLRNALELVRRIAPADPRLAWAGDVMDRQLRHMTRLVEELLDVARITEGKIVLSREPVDLRAVIGASVETAQPLVDQHRQRLQLRLPEAPVWMNGDFNRLAQIVGNLLHNACKYSEDGSTIELGLAIEEGSATIRVRDHGVGIDAALLPSIFDLFTQGPNSLDRTQAGLGVGLTLVRRLVELHGGTVEAHSDGAGRGAEFVVRLPAMSVVGGTEAAGEPAPERPAQRGQRVLIVDDNRDAAETIAQFLQLEGHEVKCVLDGFQALASVPVFAPQVVVLDIGLPGMSGYEAAKRMRELPATRHAFLVALTGYGQPEDRHEAAAAGFDHHFVKPADPMAIAALIGRWAEERSAPVRMGAERANGN